MENRQVSAVWADAALLPLAWQLCCTVESVYRHAVCLNCDVPGGMVTLLAMGKDPAPYSVVVDITDFTLFCIRSGQSVRIMGGMLSVGNLRLRLNGGAFRTLPVSGYCVVSQLSLSKGTSQARVLLPPISEGWDAGLFLSGRRKMLRALSIGDKESALRWGTGLIGLGPGLTPSGDDWLSALGVALCMEGGPLANCRSLFRMLAERAPSRTTRQGAASLLWASNGLAVLTLTNFLNSLMGCKAVEETLTRLLSLGSTSGRDLALGALDGMALICNACSEQASHTV